MIDSIGRYIKENITETGKYNNRKVDENGVYGFITIVKTFLPIGGAVSAGDNQLLLERTIDGDGISISGGNAIVINESIPLQEITFFPAGGLCIVGKADIIQHKIINIRGGATAGGSASFIPYQTIPGLPEGSIVVVIHTTPQQLYTLQNRILSIGTIRKPMGGIIGDLENANASIVLDNSDGELTGLFSPPPIGNKLVITQNSIAAIPYFTGIITNITLGESISIQMEAGERIPLTQQIPLVSTTQLPGYREDKKIPLVYGTVTLEPIAVDSDGYNFVVASHPCEYIESVFIDNAEITGWTWKNVIYDVATMATITLSKAKLTNEKITCIARGKLNPKTGGLLTNPADIVWDILANVCGIDLDYYELDQFRTAMFTKGIKLSGAITDGRKTIRSTVDALMNSCGSIWSGQAKGIAIDFMGIAAQPASHIINAVDIKSISISTNLNQIATACKLSFNFDYGQNQHVKTALFDCVNAIQKRGRTVIDLDAAWLTSSRAAAELGELFLKWKSTAQWLIKIETGGDHQSIVPGDWVEIIHPYLPDGSAVALCTNVDLEITNGNISLQFSIPAEPEQAITLQGLSSAFDAATMQGTQIQFANGSATLTFNNDKGQPLAGAKVTLDGSQVRTTDKAGKAVFSASRGVHHIKVEATGYTTMEGEIEI